MVYGDVHCAENPDTKIHTINKEIGQVLVAYKIY